MKRALLLAALLLGFGLRALAVPVTFSSQGPTGSTYTTAVIPNTSTLVTLTAASGYITIVNLSATTVLYWSPVSPAVASTSAGSFTIAPNSAWSYQGTPLSTFYIIGSAASGSYSVQAH